MLTGDGRVILRLQNTTEQVSSSEHGKNEGTSTPHVTSRHEAGEARVSGNDFSGFHDMCMIVGQKQRYQQL